MSQNERHKPAMNDGLDRVLMAKAVEAQLPRVRDVKNWTKLADAAGVARPTLWRMRRAPEVTSAATFRALEAPLHLPIGTLTAIGKHNLDELRAIGAPGALVDWVALQIS